MPQNQRFHWGITQFPSVVNDIKQFRKNERTIVILYAQRKKKSILTNYTLFQHLEEKRRIEFQNTRYFRRIRSGVQKKSNKTTIKCIECQTSIYPEWSTLWGGGKKRKKHPVFFNSPLSKSQKYIWKI